MHPDPIALPLIGLTLPAHTAFELLAVLLGTLLVVVWARRVEHISVPRMVAALAIMTVFEFLGGRLHYVAAHWDATPAGWSVLKLWSSIHAGGTVLGGSVGAVIGARLLRLPVGKLADACVPAAGVGIALARLGCFAHGCCFGSICTLPWCFSWPPGTPPYDYHVERGWIAFHAAASLPIHPLQLYFAVAGLAVSTAAIWLYPRKRYDGQVALFALVGFAAGTLALEALREFPRASYWGPLPPLAWAAAALLIIAVSTVARLRYRRERRERGDHRIPGPAAIRSALRAADRVP